MKKRERVIAAINKKDVDCIPCGFSLHFPTELATGEEGIKSHLDFFKNSDTDIIKIMNENLVPNVGVFTSPEDYNKVIDISMKSDYMINQIDFTKKILAKADPDAFSLGTLHGILASSIHPLEQSGMTYEGAREFLVECLRSNPTPVLAAMHRIADGMCELAAAYIEAGVDAVYYAALGGEECYFTDEEFAKWMLPFDLQIMKSIKDAGGYCFLHVCKDGLNMKRYTSYSKYCDVANWGVYDAPCSLETGKEIFKGATIMGGLANRSGVLVDGSEEQIKNEVKKVISDFGRTGFILGADCTISTDQDMSKLKAAVAACRE